MRTDTNLPHGITKSHVGGVCHSASLNTDATQKYRSILLAGPPGVGKGMQGALLGQIPGMYHLSSGEMFRKLDTDSTLGRIFHEYASRGDLVPDEITVQIWQDYVATQVAEHTYDPGRDLLILDGIPRNVAQAALIEAHIRVLKIVYMVCENQEVMFQRIRGRAVKENRFDDSQEAVVRHRWKIYKRDTEPVIDYYPQELVRIVDADTIPAAVLQQILMAVVPVQMEHFAPAFM